MLRFGAGKRTNRIGLGVPFGVIPGAIFDTNFATGTYYSNTGNTTAAAILTCTRAQTTNSTNLLPNAVAGASFDQFAANVLRIGVSGPKGLLYEQLGTPTVNNLLNSTAPVTQTTASLGTGTYTLWVNGTGSATSSAGTATGAGFGAAINGTSNTFTVSVAGTVVVTVAGSLNAFQLESGGIGTSLIITAGTTVTRNNDVITYNSINAASPYSMLLAISYSAAANADLLLGGTAANGSLLYASGGIANSVVNESSVVTANVNGNSSFVAGGAFKIAGRFALNDVNASMNGQIGTHDTSSNPPTLTALGFGRSLYGFGTQTGSIVISRAALSGIALSDAQLQALTP